MSKYIKLEDAIRAIEEMQNCYNGWSDTYDKAQIIGVLDELPTIEVSEDCISKEYLKSFEYINKGDFNSVETIREWIDNAPSVVPSRAEGEWTNAGVLTVHCSNCKSQFHELEAMNYCPNCGAKMKGN